MSSPYIGEIRMFAGNFPPSGWAFCDGQLMPISENDALFVLLGTTYGGDGQETFGLPNLQGRLPIHAGQGPGITQTYQLGESGGVEQVTLTTNQIPIHNHPLLATSNPGTTTNPGTNLVSNSPNVGLYIEDVTGVQLKSDAISPVGGSQPHDNFQPYLCVNFIISLFGIFPTQN